MGQTKILAGQMDRQILETHILDREILDRPECEWKVLSRSTKGKAH